jgi:hypothetical protein
VTDEVARLISDFTWLREQLARFTYRPGWTMQIQLQQGLMLLGPEYLVRINFRVADTYAPGRDIPLVAVFHISPHIAAERDEELFARWLQGVLLDVERHESREWLRRDGTIYDDPHKSFISPHKEAP